MSFGQPPSPFDIDECWEEITCTISSPQGGTPGINVEVLRETKEDVTVRISAWLRVEGKCICAKNPKDSWTWLPDSCQNDIWTGYFRATLYKLADGSCPNFGSCKGEWGPEIVRKEFTRTFVKTSDETNRISNGCSTFFSGSLQRAGRGLYFNLRNQLDFLRPLKCKKTKDEVDELVKALKETRPDFEFNE